MSFLLLVWGGDTGEQDKLRLFILSFVSLAFLAKHQMKTKVFHHPPTYGDEKK